MSPASERVTGVLSSLWGVPGCEPRSGGARQLALRLIGGHPVPLPDGGHGMDRAAFLAAAPARVLAEAVLRKTGLPRER